MKKSLLLLTLLLVSLLDNVGAQWNYPLFNITPATDTVCANQPVLFTSNNLNAHSYFWGFCSGSLDADPTGSNLGETFNFQKPRAIDIIKDSGIYYGFVLNDSSRQFLELNYGNSLDNVPAVTNLGSLTNVLPSFPKSLYIVHDDDNNNWHIFVSGGNDKATSTLARIDFGHSLNNQHPNIANFGNFMNALDGPRGIFVAKEGAYWIGYLVNYNDNNIVRLEFEKNISNTPLMYEEGNPGSFDHPNDMKAIFDPGSAQWYFYTANLGSNVNPGGSISIFTPGTSLLVPSLSGDTPIPELNGKIFGPYSFSIYKDQCTGYYFMYIINNTANSFTITKFLYPAGPYTVRPLYPSEFGIYKPTAISRIIRDHDKLYAFITNDGDSSLTKMVLLQCTNSSIPSSTAMNPPTVSYTLPDYGRPQVPATYNVYNIINAGEIDEASQCAVITVIPHPQIQFPHDTVTCHPFDTLRLFVESVDAISYTWSPNYNLRTMDSMGNDIKIWPEFNTTYHCILPFTNGCIVDTFIHIGVVHVHADAGPDRTIFDGASTILGGPLATVGPTLHLHWFPNQFLSDPNAQYPTANPPYNYTYYQQIDTTFILAYPLDITDTTTVPPTFKIDTITCTSIDTVIVYVDCNDINLPNALRRAAAILRPTHYGILNKGLIKLNYFRIYDRWGALMFETEDPTQKWDGTVNGKNVEQAVYTWIIDGFCSDGKRFNRKGNVTLIR